MSQVRTVSDTKRDFYTHHTRPINSIFRRVVEELLVEMHLLSVNADFRYDPFYALGVVTSFERFMQGYRPEADKVSIFQSMCQAIGGDANRYKEDAMALVELAKHCSGTQLIECFRQDMPPEGAQELWEKIEAIAKNDHFKYSRLFAIGVYTFLGESEPQLLEDTEKRDEMLTTVTAGLNLPEEKMKKDLDLYRSNLEKMNQVLEVLEDALAVERQRREKAEAEAKAKTAEATVATETNDEQDEQKETSESGSDA
ncbi:photosystem II biogenesis protein Psp29 [Picosynechococcus sp. PCC 8807]|uniref:photosystem II biogenesis protein Psp29 n=1 Tax=Picosynechococcus sp. PCC 8807 TaxID=195248 RepID=UPI0008106A05|nr:photosystem II biogenesis protein Psp29 [Picosynechococcus sp. PCC 8807]ANV91828.1 photosystem II biogenesis protein Psp29 [Picosynechococcus sp. PCC 8807]